MKKVIKFLLLSVILSSIPYFVRAQSAAMEQINSYRVDISINQDASINVRETIVYSFSGGEKHGIYRDIPVEYKTKGKGMSLRMTDISVTDEQGTPYKFSESREGNDKRLKIGDPDRTVKGQKTYVISYTVKGAVNYFDQHDELYWNAIGSGWDVGIDNVSASVTWPKPLPLLSLQHACYAGPAGSTKACTEISRSLLDGQGVVDKVVFSQKHLDPGENLTIVVGMPKGIVHQPTAGELAAAARQERLAMLRPLLAALAIPLATLVIMIFVWMRWGRDPKGRGTIITQFDVPDQLTPIEVGTLMDEKADQKDVTASIIYLATKGYLKINRVEEKKLIFKSDDYVLQKMGGMSENPLPGPTRLLYKALFDRDEATKTGGNDESGSVVAEIKISDLKQEFYKDYQDIRKQAYNILVSKGYFDKSPDKARAYYVAGGIVLGVIAFFFSAVLGPAIVGGCIFAGIIIIIFGFFMPKKTPKGVLAKEHLLGLKEYLKVAEADRIKFHNAPEKRPELFEKFLPYAIVFGVEKEWAKQFEGIYDQPPGWYNDPNMQSFNSLVFINSLGSFSASAMSAVTTAAGGGSGFSGGGAGGGFGGGGGGSW